VHLSADVLVPVLLQASTVLSTVDWRVKASEQHWMAGAGWRLEVLILVALILVSGG
jgi:hypothetical protein